METSESFDHRAIAVDPVQLGELHRLFTDYCRFADRQQAPALAQLFLANGCITIGSAEVNGREAINAFLHQRFNANRVTRHVWSNLYVQSATDDFLICTSLQQTFEYNAEGGESEIRVIDVKDVISKSVNGQWLFKDRKLDRVMAVKTHQSTQKATQ
jgi:SnoaL-like domain